MVASVPQVLQDASSVEAFKTGIAAGLPGVTSGMIEVFVLLPSSRRLSTGSTAFRHDRRLQFGASSEVFVFYRIVMTTTNSQLAAFVVQKIEAAPVQMMLSIQQALNDINVATVVANIKFPTPVVHTIYDSTCVFRYWRFMPVAVRASQAAGGVALASLFFYDVDIVNITVDSTNVGLPSADVVPLNAFDGDPSSYWHNSNLLPLQVDFGEPKNIAFYQWVTSNSAQAADPIRWRLEASSDAKIWNVVDNRAVVDHMTPLGRQKSAGLFNVGCSDSLPPSKMEGATENTSVDQLLIFMFVLCGILLFGLCVGCCVYAYRRLALPIIGLQKRRSKVSSEEEPKKPKRPPQMSGDSRIDLSANPLSPFASPKSVDGRSESPTEALIQGYSRQAGKDSSALRLSPPSLLEHEVHGSDEPTEPGVLYPSEGRDEPSNAVVLYPSDYHNDHVYPSGTLVAIVGLVDHHENNGAMAEVVKYDARKGKYTVKMTSCGKKVILKPGNLVLAICQDHHMVEDLEEEVEDV